MSEYRIANRYAKSLIGLAQQQNILDAVYNDMQSLLKTISENVSLENLLKNPIVHSDKKMSILKQIFEKNFNKLSIDFFNIIVRKRRESFMKVIANSFINQYNDINKITRATVKTAVAISDATQKQIINFLQKESGMKVELKNIVEPELIGGMIVQMGDRMYDASIAGKLNQARKELLTTYISK